MTTALLLLLVCLCLSAISGIAADSYVNILTQPGMILDFWARWIYSLKDRYVTPHEFWTTPDWDKQVNEWIAKREARADYILKPLLTCVYCVGGQLGFWLSVYVQLSFFTHFYLIFSLGTAVLSVWFGGLFQYIQKKYFPL